MRGLVRSMDEQAVVDALSVGDPAKVVAAFDWQGYESALTTHGEHLAGEFMAAGHKAIGNVRLQKATAAATRLGMRFDLNNPRAIAWADQNAARLVVETSQLQQDAIRSIAVRSLSGEMDVHGAAGQIRGVVGLHSRYANAVYNHHTELLSSGFAPDKAAEMADRYAARLLSVRADTIARTEIMSAQSAGRTEGWQQAIDAGLVNAQTSTRQWAAASDDRTCLQCDDLDGEEVGLGDLFSDGTDAPPAHPDCRCVTLLVQQP